MTKRRDKEMEGGWRADLIGFIAVGGFVVICTLILTGGTIVDSMKDVGLILLGQLSMKFETVVDYFYGSSQGSATKSEQLNEIANKS